MFKIWRQLILQSSIASIILAIAIGGLFDVVDFVILKEPFNSRFILLTLVTSVFLGIFMHEFVKAQEKLKEKKETGS